MATETDTGRAKTQLLEESDVFLDLEPRKYSPAPLEMYDRGRQIILNDAYSLVKYQNDPKLSRSKLTRAINTKEITVYEFKGERYLDRLDIGRVFHRKIEKRGLTIDRYFSTERRDPTESVGEYAPRALKIEDVDGNAIFEMQGAIFPTSWNDKDAKIVAQKYFYRPDKTEWKKKLEAKLGTEHESSLVHLVKRVSNFFADAGWELGYFKTEKDRDAFRDELTFLQINRMIAFNSPVYFNAGLYNEYGIEGTPAMNYWRNPDTGEVVRIRGGGNIKPQNHACFIRAPKDHLPSILGHHLDEGSIFSNGSGVGGNLDLREEGAKLSSGGQASGPLSFLKTFDDDAATIKSGGKSRRAARMQSMRYTHPDSRKFVLAKVKEDKKALALMQKGYSAGMDGEAYTTVTFQSTNLSIRLDAHFFEQVEKDGEIELRSVTTNKVTERVSARKFLQEISFGAWRVGDPGVQYETPIQEYNTCINSGAINSSNPCSEYMFLDDTSCDLASSNLLAFSDRQGNFDVKRFSRANRIVAIAQEIANHASAYPVKDIARISPEFATIGLGFSNLGALLMRRGVPYDSDEGRAIAATLSAIVTGNAYETSTELAEHLGTFVHYEFNRKPMAGVMQKHRRNLEDIAWKYVPKDLKEEAFRSWDSVLERGEKVGHRMAQASVLAPAGTISFLMGCDTTGAEPPVALVIYKDLAGGGRIKLTINEVPNALANLGYTKKQIEDIEQYIEREETMVGAPHILPDHVPIFATSMGNSQGIGAIPFEGHIKMVGANQPFISGAISKTNNFPHYATVKDIYDGWILGHNLRLKGLTVFRSDSKPISPLNLEGRSYVELKRGEKEDLPTRRQAHEFEVEIRDDAGSTPLHLIVSEYPDGRPGQITFLSYKAGSPIKATLENTGILASTSLKRGVHLEEITKGWIGQEFSPRGLVFGHPFIKTASSPLDFAGRVLRLEYLGDLEMADNKEGLEPSKLRGYENGAFRTYEKMKIDDWDIEEVLKNSELGGFVKGRKTNEKEPAKTKKLQNSRGITCKSCGHIMRPTGPNCYECTNCPNKAGGCAQ